MRTQWKKLFFEGKLVENAQLDGLKLKLILKAKYQNKTYYKSINQMFKFLCENNPQLQNKFSLPSIHKGEPYLTLKNGHGFQGAAQALEALRSCANPLPRTKAKKEVPQTEKLIIKFKIPPKKAEILNEPTSAKPDDKTTKPMPFNSELFGDLNFEDDLNVFGFSSDLRPPSFGDLLLLENPLSKSRELIFSSSPKQLRANDALPVEKAKLATKPRN